MVIIYFGKCSCGRDIEQTLDKRNRDGSGVVRNDWYAAGCCECGEIYTIELPDDKDKIIYYESIGVLQVIE